MASSISSNWRKSRRCDSSACVEVRMNNGFIQIRNSKDPDGSVLTYTGTEWLAFVAGAKSGEFDL